MVKGGISIPFPHRFVLATLLPISSRKFAFKTTARQTRQRSLTCILLVERDRSSSKKSNSMIRNLQFGIIAGGALKCRAQTFAADLESFREPARHPAASPAWSPGPQVAKSSERKERKVGWCSQKFSKRKTEEFGMVDRVVRRGGMVGVEWETGS